MNRKWTAVLLVLAMGVSAGCAHMDDNGEKSTTGGSEKPVVCVDAERLLNDDLLEKPCYTLSRPNLRAEHRDVFFFQRVCIHQGATDYQQI